MTRKRPTTIRVAGVSRQETADTLLAVRAMTLGVSARDLHAAIAMTDNDRLDTITYSVYVPDDPVGGLVCSWQHGDAW